MNKTILFATFCIIGFTTLGNTQVPISFRSNALGGIIDDDLDLIYDPIELRFVGRTDTLSGNGIYDIGEVYSDLGNNVWDVGELYEEKNGNMWYDIGEPYEDLGNGIYDEGEPFEDLPIIYKGGSTRLYTNLSNLTSSQEQLFANSSDNEFLIGISSQNPLMKSLWHSVLVQVQNSETSDSVGIDSDLDGNIDIYGDGTLIDTYTAYLDENNDGNFDHKNMISQEKSDFTTDDSYSFILNNAFTMGKLTLGVKLSHGNATYSGNTASSNLGSGTDTLSTVVRNNPTFARTVTTYLIDDKYNDLTRAEDGDFLADSTVSSNNIDASVMRPFLGFELRGDFSLLFNHITSNVNDTYSGQYKYFIPEVIPYANNHTESDSYIVKTDEDGYAITLSASMRKTFNEQEERKHDGFWKVGVSVTSGSYDYSKSTSSQFSSIDSMLHTANDVAPGDSVTTVFSDGLSTDTGTKTLTHINFYSRFNIPLGENVHFGIGGFLNQSITKRETNYTVFNKNVTETNLYDQLTIIDDYVMTETDSLKADRIYNVNTTSFTCPVGLEYRMGKKNSLSLRFGTIFTKTNQSINNEMKITDSIPHVTIKEFRVVTIEPDTSYIDNIYESISEHTRTTFSSTVFTYGLGYNPVGNLQIDLLGFLGTSDNSFFDTSFYRNLRLSFTLKF